MNHGGAIEKSSVPLAIENQILLPDLGKPKIEKIHYQLEIFCHQVWPDGQSAHTVTAEVTADMLEVRRAIESTSGTLAWISFFAKAKAQVKHSDQVTENGRFVYDGLEGFDKQREVVYGENIGLGVDKFVVDKTDSGITLMTEEEIIKEGSLRPYMAQWLGALVYRGNYSDSSIDRLKKLLPNPDYREDDGF